MSDHELATHDDQHTEEPASLPARDGWGAAATPGTVGAEAAPGSSGRSMEPSFRGDELVPASTVGGDGSREDTESAESAETAAALSRVATADAAGRQVRDEEAQGSRDRAIHV